MEPGKRCVVNFVTHGYIRGQLRLRNTLKEHGYQGRRAFWDCKYPPGCPDHHTGVPYAFKTYALKDAQKSGNEVLLWLDASMYAIRSPEPVFRFIEENGYMMEFAGQWLGWYSTDAFLAKHGMTRDEAMKIPMVTAGFLGLDMRHPAAVEFLDRWHVMAQDGVSFIGPWKDSNDDPNYKGHRHDMSAASLIIHQMGLKMVDPHFMVYGAYTPKPSEDVCFLRMQKT